MPRFLNEFGVSIAVLVFTFRPEVDPAISDTNPHPEQRTWIGKKRLTRDLVIVVWEREVDTARVDIYPIT